MGAEDIVLAAARKVESASRKVKEAQQSFVAAQEAEHQALFELQEAHTKAGTMLDLQRAREIERHLADLEQKVTARTTVQTPANLESALAQRAASGRIG